MEQDAGSQADFSGGDDTRARNAKAGPSGADTAPASAPVNVPRLAADSERSSHDNRRRPTPKGGVPSTPARSEDDFQVSSHCCWTRGFRCVFSPIREDFCGCSRVLAVSKPIAVEPCWLGNKGPLLRVDHCHLVLFLPSKWQPRAALGASCVIFNAKNMGVCRGTGK